ncbi:MAG TPA: malto-oligosyltrehalose synthase [Chthoniobacteraceae bacterium]|jgi:(1->4)-alpha-D-glucan 1-alpha-D-glucosylmutase|nr:malto-oligosyltrehalose synthase [Chthoniobacteraceae bacterium]
MNHPGIPSATYRLQFNKDFTFAMAAEIAEYLRDLGISHVYASPYFKAAPGSTHGYDVTDHNALNPEVGSGEDYARYAAVLQRNGLGQVLDFVPNHMGIGPLNPYWMDVLENGQGSKFADYFDIDWHPLKQELAGKVLLPILGDQYGRVLEKGELKLNFEQGSFHLAYYETRLPVNPRSYCPVLKKALELSPLPAEDEGMIEVQSVATATEHLPRRYETEPEKISERNREKEVVKKRLDRVCQEHPAIAEAIGRAVEWFNGKPGEPHSFDALDLLIGEQAYRLSYWRVAAEEINYRRFFDINNLAAIKMELPEVFEATHKLLFELIKSGAVTGVRIDHVDGLWNPREYLENLQAKYNEVTGQEGERSLYLLVEKILMSGEKLRPDWPVHGTTGYDFTNQLIELYVDRAAEKAMTDTYHRFIEENPRFAEMVYQKKRLTMQLALSSEVHVLASMLDRLSEQNRWYRDFTLSAIYVAVREVIACFPVYRTYAEPGREMSDDDRMVIDRAVRAARRRNPGMDASIFHFLRETLLLRFPENIDEAGRAEHLRFVMKFQQCTGPITAKGIEDTAFYIYNRLAALNEVGGEPDHFGGTPELLHKQNGARLADFPHAMLATSTHDTKRSEDVRARLAAISEIPDAWRRGVHRFRTANRKHKRDVEEEHAPDANEEYLIYQTLAGAWPLDGVITEEFVARIQEYMAKAIKEAKVNSSWIQPNENWDAAVREFIATILSNAKGNKFPEQFRPLAGQIAQLGAINALSQTLIKLTAPGVPDTYQGNEIWDFSLVDPDNRRAVDYARRRQMLGEIAHVNPRDLLANWRDGRIKLFLIQKLLRYRRDHFDLFAQGEYAPIAASGAFPDSVFAFARRFGEQTILVIAPRLTARVGFPPVGTLWQDTRLEFEPEQPLRDLLTGRQYSGRLSEALENLPVAAYVSGV